MSDTCRLQKLQKYKNIKNGSVNEIAILRYIKQEIIFIMFSLIF